MFHKLRNGSKFCVELIPGKATKMTKRFFENGPLGQDMPCGMVIKGNKHNKPV